MRVLVVRHAIAEEREIFARTGKSDDERPLTARGERRMAAAARGLTAVLPAIDLIATSPLTRAAQTAAIVASAYSDAPVEELPALAPGSDPNDVMKWLRRHQERDAVALVGHEPDLSILISWLTTRSRRPAVSLKKGAACLVEFPDTLGAGRGTIEWLLAPKQLRALGSDGA